MDFLKALFGDEAITYEQFVEAVNKEGYKLADLSKGDYVGKKKYEDEIQTLNTTITELNGQIKTRDIDIGNLKKSLEDGGKDNETKIAELTTQLTTLQGDYKKAKTDYEAKLSKQAYEFGVKEFSNSKKFTSSAAKRDFEREMLSANLTMKDNAILGAEDFMNKYIEGNPDAIAVEEPNPTPAPAENPKPTFVQPTPPAPTPDANPFNFNFAGVR